MSSSSTELRPIESRMVSLRDAGVGLGDIAMRFRKTPEFVERVLRMAEIPRRPRTVDRRLRPIERRVLDMRAEGLGRDEIGRRFKRSERSILQIEGLAMYKKGLSLLSESGRRRAAG